MSDARLLFPVTHSILDANALSPWVAANYGIRGTLECRLLAFSLNDTYLVEAEDDRFVGLVVDQNNERELSADRIREWAGMLQEEFAGY